MTEVLGRASNHVLMLIDDEYFGENYDNFCCRATTPVAQLTGANVGYSQSLHRGEEEKRGREFYGVVNFQERRGGV